MELNRRSVLLTLASLATTVGTLTVSAETEVRAEYHEAYPLNKQGRVSLDNLNGDVRIVTWDREEIQVDAMKRAKKQEYLDEVRIEVDSKADRVRIKTKYPTSKPHRDRNDSTIVDYTLTVPRQCLLDKISAVNGGIEIENVSGNVEASSVNGRVTATGLEGDVELSTVNGSVKAGLAEMKKPVSLKSVNGSVTLTIPAGVNARVSADTLNGGIKNDFSLKAKDHFPVGRSLDGKLGECGPKIKMSTVNGGIHLDSAGTVAAESR